jgi:prevent-host-death family protein
MVIMTNKTAQASAVATLSAAEAKARFAQCLRSAEHGTPVVVTRHGKPVAALVAAGELEHLERLRAAGPSAGLASVAGGWRGSDELVRNVLAIRRTRPRRTPRLA